MEEEEAKKLEEGIGNTDEGSIPLDSTSSHHLHSEQKQALYKTFLLLQKKSTKAKNEVDERDIPTLLRSIGLNPLQKHIEGIILKVRGCQQIKTSQGFVDYQCLEDTIASSLKDEKEAYTRHSEEHILNALRVLAQDKKDYFEPQYLAKLTMDKGLCFSEEEVERMIQTFKDKDTGLIWHDEMAEILSKDGIISPNA